MFSFFNEIKNECCRLKKKITFFFIIVKVIENNFKIPVVHKVIKNYDMDGNRFIEQISESPQRTFFKNYFHQTRLRCYILQ